MISTISPRIQLQSETAEIEKFCKLLVHRSTISLDGSLKQKIHQELVTDDISAKILNELKENGTNKINKNNENLRINNELIVVYLNQQSEELYYWRIAVPGDLAIER